VIESLAKRFGPDTCACWPENGQFTQSGTATQEFGGPGIPDPPPGSPVTEQIRFSNGFSIKKKSILGGLHHEYRLEGIAA
jgi:hypothetical protein